jgi:hypothetical protein
MFQLIFCFCQTKNATVFVSHSWYYNFLDVVKALHNYFENDHSAVIWFDMFSVNQNMQGEKKTFQWLGTTFKGAINSMEKVLVVVSSFDDGRNAFKRAWCVFEMFCATDTGRDMHFTFLANYDFANVLSLIENIDIDGCSAKEDGESGLIKRTIIKYNGSMKRFNSKIRREVMKSFESQNNENSIRDSSLVNAAYDGNDQTVVELCNGGADIEAIDKVVFTYMLTYFNYCIRLNCFYRLE